MVLETVWAFTGASERRTALRPGCPDEDDMARTVECIAANWQTKSARRSRSTRTCGNLTKRKALLMEKDLKNVVFEGRDD